MVSRGPDQARPDFTRAYNTLSDRMYELEARSARAAESLRSTMGAWGDPAVGDEPDQATSRPDSDRDRELKERLEEEISLWHEENGWTSTMPERDRLDLIRSIQIEIDPERRR